MSVVCVADNQSLGPGKLVDEIGFERAFVPKSALWSLLLLLTVQAGGRRGTAALLPLRPDDDPQLLPNSRLPQRKVREKEEDVQSARLTCTPRSS